MTRFAIALLSSAAAASALALPLCAHAQMDAQMEGMTITGSAGTSVTLQPLESFDGAWAMTFLPDGRALVTEKSGTIWLLGTDGKKLGEIDGAPDVTARGQGGLGDIILDSDFAANNRVYLSYVERDEADTKRSGAAVERAELNLTATGGTLTRRDVIWRQFPKVTGNGHYGHRLAISPEGADGGAGYLFITSGDRQKFTPAQNMDMNLGKVVRINTDGTVPSDNPFYGQGGVTNEIWSLGHRNPLGLDFSADGSLWLHEMGPRHGDELNKVERSENYGYPEVSNGDHYSGKEIPDHDAFPVYEAPRIWWDPAISPAGFDIYHGDLFADWKGDGFIGGLSSQALIRVSFEVPADEATDKSAKPRGADFVAAEAERFEWGKRIREIEEGPDGAIYVLEDRKGRLVKITPG